MTDYTARAASIRARLEDLARDLESHLGLASRSHEWNPSFDRANHFPPETYDDAAVESARRSNVDRFVQEYQAQASRAAVAVRHAQLPGQKLTADEKAARAAVDDLVAAISYVRNHDDAVALIGTLGGK
jgi:hypothetical protein